MCLYCVCGDWAFRHDPPWNPPYSPYIPQPLVPLPIQPWPLEKLREYRDLLQQIKDLEDKIGCPCEPNKADYLELFKRQIELLEKKGESRR